MALDGERIGSQKYSKVDEYDDEDENDMEDFQMLNSSGDARKRSNWKIYASIVFCVLFFSMIMVFSHSQKESVAAPIKVMTEAPPDVSTEAATNASTDAPTDAPVTFTFESLRSYFAPISSISAVHSESSPQFEAIEWIVQNGIHDSSELLEVYILATFYYSLDGPNWKEDNFMDHSTSVCDWRSDGGNGIRCEEEDGQLVNKIQFKTNGLNGTIPSEIRYLSDLRVLDLAVDHINGMIPSEIGYLSNLHHLDLHGNSITGKIPTQIGNIASNHDRDIYINLAENLLTGSIPSEIGNIDGLKGLFLNQNQLNGTLPSQDMSRLPRLHKLNVATNRLHGSIDRFEYGQLSSMEYLWFNENHLTGTIPPGLGLLPSGTMKIIELENNFFHGALPSEIGFLTNLEILWFQDNQVVGNVNNIVCTGSFAAQNTSIRADSCKSATLLKCSCCCCENIKKSRTCT